MPLLALALIAAPAPAAAKEKPDAPSAKMETLLQNCDAHKFETVIETTVDGQPKHSRVKLCGTEGQSDADWQRTLKDAVAKTEANLQMPAPVRDQIVGALKAEIARLNGAPSPASTGLAGVLPAPRDATIGKVEGYSKLPALPAPRQAAPAAPMSDFAQLPAIPTAPPAPTRVLAGGIGASIPMLPQPRMTFICETPGESIEGPCTDFTRDTLLTVRADEDLPSGTSLRFVRSGDPRADVQLAQLKRGKSARLTLPSEVCSHAAGGSLEIRIVRSVAALPTGQEVGKDGPYNLRC
jgi:hypothetical protein